MTHVNRRSLLVLGGSLPAFALMGCATVSEGNVYSATLDVSKVKSYLNAGLIAATTFVLLGQQLPHFEKYVPKIEAVAAQTKDVLDNFNDMFGDKLTVTLDTSTQKTILESVFVVLEDLQKLVFTAVEDYSVSTDIIPPKVLEQIIVINRSLFTLVSVLRMVLLPALSNRDFNTTDSAEQKALRVLSA